VTAALCVANRSTFPRARRFTFAPRSSSISLRKRSDEDPLERLIGLVGDGKGPTDVAANHDHDLYGAPKDVS